MNQTTTKERRGGQPSNAVMKGAMIGTPAATVVGYAAGWLATKYNIPFEVVGAGLSLLGSGMTAVISFISKGGRKGESQ